MLILNMKLFIVKTEEVCRKQVYIGRAVKSFSKFKDSSCGYEVPLLTQFRNDNFI
jgi:hypothetical protein